MSLLKVEVISITQEVRPGVLPGAIEVKAIGVTHSGEEVTLRLRGVGHPIVTKIADFLHTLSKELAGPASQHLMREGTDYAS